MSTPDPLFSLQGPPAQMLMMMMMMMMVADISLRFAGRNSRFLFLFFLFPQTVYCGWTGSFVSLCLPSCVSRCLPAWTLWVDGFIFCLPSFVSRWMSGTSPCGQVHLSPLSPFICHLRALHGFVSGRIHLSPFDSLYLAPLGSQLGRVQLSPFVSFLLSPSLDAWHGSVGGRINLSPFVSPYLSPVVTDSCAVYSAGRHVCLRLRNACLSARMRLIKPRRIVYRGRRRSHFVQFFISSMQSGVLQIPMDCPLPTAGALGWRLICARVFGDLGFQELARGLLRWALCGFPGCNVAVLTSYLKPARTFTFILRGLNFSQMHTDGRRDS